MIRLDYGETIEVNERMKSSYGKGNFYSTSKAFILEVGGKGVIFHREHEKIASLESPKKDRLRVFWFEGRDMHNYEFRVDCDAPETARFLNEKHKYNANFYMGSYYTVQFGERRREEIRKKREEWYHKELRKAEKQYDKKPNEKNLRSLRRWQGAMAGAHAVKSVRATSVPDDIPDHHVWNDAWYNHDPFGKDRYFFPNRDKDIPHARNEDNNLMSVPADRVFFHRGYPYVEVEEIWDKKCLGVFLPTFTEDMIDTDFHTCVYLSDERARRKLAGKDTKDIPFMIYAFIAQYEFPIINGEQGDMLRKDTEIANRFGTLLPDWVKRYGLKAPTKDEVLAYLELREKYAPAPPFICHPDKKPLG